ncbi:MAG: TOBE-like domain-containing protein, partial [Cyanobium sp.]
VIVTHDQEEAMEVADRIVVMNEGRIEQIGTPAEIYDQPASPFVMSFVGAVNVLPSHVALAPNHDQRSELFIRPHDLELHRQPQEGSVPAVLRRLTHLGRDIQAELTLASGEVVVAQLPRERIDYRELQAGDALHITSRDSRTFVPDFVI